MKDYLLDIKKQIDGTDFGDVHVHIKRARSKTTGMAVLTVDTHNFHSNEEALANLLHILDGLLVSGNDFELNFNIQIKQGMIKLIGYQNIKQTTYGN